MPEHPQESSRTSHHVTRSLYNRIFHKAYATTKPIRNARINHLLCISLTVNTGILLRDLSVTRTAWAQFINAIIGLITRLFSGLNDTIRVYVNQPIAFLLLRRLAPLTCANCLLINSVISIDLVVFTSVCCNADSQMRVSCDVLLMIETRRNDLHAMLLSCCFSFTCKRRGRSQRCRCSDIPQLV